MYVLIILQTVSEIYAVHSNYLGNFNQFFLTQNRSVLDQVSDKVLLVSIGNVHVLHTDTSTIQSVQHSPQFTAGVFYLTILNFLITLQTQKREELNLDYLRKLFK